MLSLVLLAIEKILPHLSIHNQTGLSTDMTITQSVSWKSTKKNWSFIKSTMSQVSEGIFSVGFPLQKNLTLIGKSWKTHPEIFLKFSFIGSSHIPFYWKTHPGKILHIIYGFSQKIRIDEFSSKTACVTTRKMKISEKILDEFSMIC